MNRHSRTRSQSDAQKGFTLTELGIVMGVAGVIIGAIWVGASRANEAARVNDALTELQTIQQNLTDLMDGRTLPGAYPSIQAQPLLADGVIPDSYSLPAVQLCSNNGTTANSVEFEYQL